MDILRFCHDWDADDVVLCLGTGMIGLFFGRLCALIAAFLARFSSENLKSGLEQTEPYVAVENSKNEHLHKDQKRDDDHSQSYPPEPVFELNCQNKTNDDARGHVQNERNEKSEKTGVILFTNAIIEEDTVVVKIVNTSFASRTMMTLI